MKLEEIAWPVYRISLRGDTNSLINENGKLIYRRFFYDKKKDLLDMWEHVLDDLTIDEPTLAMRRLRLAARGEDLFPLGFALFYLVDLINTKRRYGSSRTYIDSKGTIFKYKSTSKFYKVTCHKINKIIHNEQTGGGILDIEGCHTRFPLLFKINIIDYPYVGILNAGKSKVLFNVSREPFETYRRKI